MDGDGTRCTPEDVFRDFRARRPGRIKRLTTEKDNLCLYGPPSETWEVNLPAKDVTLELPESLVAEHSDAWLLAVALYVGARFGFDKESRTILMKLPSNYKDEFLVKHSDKFGAMSWFVKNQTIMNAATDSGNVVYEDCVDGTAVGTSKCLYQCHKKNSQDNNKQVDLAGRTQKAPAKINILVRLLSGRTACICLWKTDHIGQLMSHIEDQEGIPKMHMMLLYGRTTLEEGCCLSDYNMENNSTVNVIHGLRGGNIDRTLDDFLSDKQYTVEQPDQWTAGEKWLTDDAKRKIHSTYCVIFQLHQCGICLGEFPVKKIPIYLDRARTPDLQDNVPFSIEKGRKDYDSFVTYLKEVFGTPLPIELGHFLDALSKMPHDIRDQDYHRQLYCYWGLMTSARRYDYITDTGLICKEGKQEVIEELVEIMKSINRKHWLYPILQEQPFRDLNDEGKIPGYLESEPLDILIFMRDSLKHPTETCSRLQMEKIFYLKFWKVWDTLIHRLIRRKSDISNFIEQYVTY